MTIGATSIPSSRTCGNLVVLEFLQMNDSSSRLSLRAWHLCRAAAIHLELSRDQNALIVFGVDTPALGEAMETEIRQFLGPETRWKRATPDPETGPFATQLAFRSEPGDIWSIRLFYIRVVR